MLTVSLSEADRCDCHTRVMLTSQAEAVVAELQRRDIFAHVKPTGLSTAAIRIQLPTRAEAIWDGSGAGLEAQILRDGMLVDFIPVIEGSASFDTSDIVTAIADQTTRYLKSTS